MNLKYFIPQIPILPPAIFPMIPLSTIPWLPTMHQDVAIPQVSRTHSHDDHHNATNDANLKVKSAKKPKERLKSFAIDEILKKDE